MAMFHCDLPGFRKVASGKVREIFDLDDHLLFVATDRLSAFDCILPDPIPAKGRVLTQLSAFWFAKFGDVPHHLVTAEFADFPSALRNFPDLAGRSMIVKKCTPLPVECVVRGYLAGSGWKEYQAAQTICGLPLPPHLELASALPEPIFTPSTKAASGHDQNITPAACARLVGTEIAAALQARSLALYSRGRDHAAERGLILADTKFEWGLLDGELVLIDECLTPDSSRFWPADAWQPGSNPPSFDKQGVRDYLETLPWDKQPPAPALPPAVISQTTAQYREAYQRLTGADLSY